MNPIPAADARSLVSLRALWLSVLGMLHTRLELLGVEFAQERERFVLSLVCAAAAVLLAFFALLMAALLLVALSWETPYRLPVLGLLVAGPAMAAAIVAAMLVRKARRTPRAFDGSLRTLAADLAALR